MIEKSKYKGFWSANDAIKIQNKEYNKHCKDQEAREKEILTVAKRITDDVMFVTKNPNNAETRSIGYSVKGDQVFRFTENSPVPFFDLRIILPLTGILEDLGYDHELRTTQYGEGIFLVKW